MTERSDDQRARALEGEVRAETHTAENFLAEMDSANDAPLWDRYAKLNTARPITVIAVGVYA